MLILTGWCYMFIHSICFRTVSQRQIYSQMYMLWWFLLWKNHSSLELSVQLAGPLGSPWYCCCCRWTRSRIAPSSPPRGSLPPPPAPGTWWWACSRRRSLPPASLLQSHRSCLPRMTECSKYKKSLSKHFCRGFISTMYQIFSPSKHEV